MVRSSSDADYRKPPLVGRSTGQGRLSAIDDVDAIFQKALATGGTEVITPEDTEWGSRRARILEPEGTEWSFGTYEPGAAW